MMADAGTVSLSAELQNYGLTSRSLRLLGDAVGPELVDYLDLVKPRSPTGRPELLPDAVGESQGRPLLFVINESRLARPAAEQESQLKHLRRILACRGDRAYLARVRPGELLVTPVSLSDRPPEWESYRPGTGEALTFFSRLALGHFDGQGEPDDADFVFKEMFNLLNQGADRLAHLLGRTNVLSLVGRALFFRFLRDRHVVTDRDTNQIAPNADGLLACFDNAENAHATSQWLDRTFNGDFLPLTDGGSRAFFDGIAGGAKLVFAHLSAIVRALEPVGAVDYQTRLKLKWSDFDFAHVPVGLLSQVYEAFCWKWELLTAKETSVHYTPRRIAAALVEEAFDGLPKAHEARVLDPACGAGVFLVLAFRRLYRERWNFTGRPPDTKAIRAILEEQLCGFDISDSALRLAALSLYLTAIELDPEPVPPEKLRFKALNNLVLFNHRRSGVDPEDRPVIGSLGAHVGTRFDGQFDLVLSNPPWTSLPEKEKKLAGEFTQVSRGVLERKGEGDLAGTYQNPDSAPDLPFLCRSTEWCKAGGRIAMALPARILLKQEEVPRRAREKMFRLVEVTGIINGSNLSDTEVWPEMNQPFLLFFARNRRPKPGQVIRFVSPHWDALVNRTGEMWIDSESAQPVEVEATIEEPWLWKALAVGTSLDVEVVGRIKAAPGRPLQAYWDNHLRLVSSTGYQVKEKQKARQDSSFMKGLPDLHSPKPGFEEAACPCFLVEVSRLLLFSRDTLFRSRKRPGDEAAVYRAPLTLVKASPGTDRKHGRALLSLHDVAYNERFYGYSAAGHPAAESLARYVQLFAHSSIWLHYSLMVSPEFGSERRKFQKADLDECPIYPWDNLAAEDKKEAASLSSRLIRGDESVFEDIDRFFGRLFSLDALDLEVIHDTLDVGLPYGEFRSRACAPPKEGERTLFKQRLETVIRPFFKVLGKEPRVIIWKPDDPFLQKETPFGLVVIGTTGAAIAEPDALFRGMILRLADDTGATRIVQQVEGGLLVGLRCQYRYWTPSRARLLGVEIVRQHMDVFEG